MPETKSLSAVFETDKDTKNTIRFSEVVTTEPPICNTIYIQKYALNRIGSPNKVKVTIEPA